MLATGQSSRLYQKLVKEQESAIQVGEGTSEQRGPSLEEFVMFVRPGKNVADVEKSFNEEVKRLQDELISDRELETIRMRSKTQQIRALRGTLNRAEQLSEYAVFYNDPGRINTYTEHLQQVTKEDIRRVARKYLQDANKTVIVTLPKPKEAVK